MPRPSPHLCASLGDDLAALVEPVDSELTAATPVTMLPASADRRATYRLEFADGRVLKGRIAGAPSDAELIERINRRLDARYFSTVVARRGNALLETWIEGAPLGAEETSEALLARCGTILASVHRAAWPGAPRGEDVVARRHHMLEGYLARLETEGLLSGRIGARLRGKALEARPERPAVGILHHDYCAENLVLAAPTRPVNVDNGSCRIGALGEDLARTWYRWPVSDASFEAFLDGYRRAAVRPPEPDAATFWRIVAVAGSAADRLRAGSDRVRFPLGVLELLADGADAHIGSLAALDAAPAPAHG